MTRREPKRPQRVRAGVMGTLIVFGLACSDAKEQSVIQTVTGSASATISEAELLRRWFDAMEKQMAADARRVATQQFASQTEAEQALMTLTPAGFQPRPEFFQKLFDEAGPPETIGRRLADHAATHGDDMERRATRMLEQLEPLLKQVFENVQRQFPRQSPVRSITAPN